MANTGLRFLEDEYDLMVFEEHEKDRQSNNLKTRPISELWRELY